MEIKKSAISSFVLTALFASVLVSNHANAISNGNLVALQEIRETARTICLLANDHTASRRDIAVEGRVKFNALIGKIINLEGVQIGGRYKDSTQTGILIDEITDDVISAQLAGGAACGLSVLHELKDFLLIPENKQSKQVS